MFLYTIFGLLVEFSPLFQDLKKNCNNLNIYLQLERERETSVVIFVINKRLEFLIYSIVNLDLFFVFFIGISVVRLKAYKTIKKRLFRSEFTQCNNSMYKKITNFFYDAVYY